MNEKKDNVLAQGLWGCMLAAQSQAAEQRAATVAQASYYLMQKAEQARWMAQREAQQKPDKWTDAEDAEIIELEPLGLEHKT